MDLRPLPNESQPQHFTRCFDLASGDTDAKTRACLDAWRQAHPDLKAQQRFAKGEFELSPNHVSFCEHTVPGPNGKPETYDKAALEGIVDRLNRRIADTGDYVPVVDGHTPTEEDRAKGAPIPDILGWQGNFRLAKIGNVTPRFAIVADEYHRTDRAAELKNKPRRSVEIWLHPNMGDRYWDPVAALGAITPRLDLGLPAKLQKTPSGVAIARYDAVSAGPLNSSVPGVNTPRQPEKERYDMMTPEEMKQLADMLTQSLVAALKAEPAPAADPAAPPADPTKMGTPGADPSPPATDPNADPMKPQGYSKGSDVARYARELAERDQKIATLERSAKDHQAKLDAMEQAARTETRKAAYAKLGAEGYLFDEAEELKDTANMTDPQFDAHMVRVRKNYAKNHSVRGPLYVPPAEAHPAGQKANDDSLEIARYAQKEGVSFDAARVAVQKQRGAKAGAA